MKCSTSISLPTSPRLAIVACLLLTQCAQRPEAHSAASSKPADADWCLAHAHPPTFYPTDFTPTKSGLRDASCHYLAERAASFYIPRDHDRLHHRQQVFALQEASITEQRKARQTGGNYPGSDKQVIAWVAKHARVDMTKHNSASEQARQTATTALVRLPLTALMVGLGLVSSGGLDMSNDMDTLWSD
jgi:hypothetical protein